MHQSRGVRVSQCRERLPQEPQRLWHGERPFILHQLRQAGPVDQLHRVPAQPGPAADIEDVDDVDVIEPRGQLGLPAKTLHHRGILGELRVKYLERHLALQMQVAHPVYPAESPGSQLVEQFVIVAQRPPKPLLPAGAVLLRDPSHR